jgi:hypothetical protein
MKVSLSPLEIAKAFKAKRLEGVDSNAEVRELLLQLGTRNIRYGLVGIETEGADGLIVTHGALMMDEPEEITPPRRGTVFD